MGTRRGPAYGRRETRAGEEETAVIENAAEASLATERPRRWRRRVAVTLIGAGVAVGAWWTLGQPGLLWAVGLVAGVERPAVRPALPEPSGPYNLGTVELHLVDRHRRDPWLDGEPRELMVSVWYPAAGGGAYPLAPYMGPGAVAHFERSTLRGVGLEPDEVDLEGVRTHAYAGAPVDVGQTPRPVLVYSPGGGLPRTLGTVLVEDLASRGYVVVTIDHTYEASEVEFPGGRIETASLPDEAGVQETIAARVADVRFVLNQLESIRDGDNPDAEGRPLPGGLPAALDLSAVGAFGHSAGGFTAAEVMLDDDRIDAGANLDGSLIYSRDEGRTGEVTKRGLDRPFLLMGAGTSGVQDLPHTHRSAADWGSFWEHSTGWKLDLHVPEGEHFTFADHQAIVPQLDEKLGVPDWLVTGMMGTVDPTRIVAAQRAYLAAFFDLHLRGEDQGLLEGPSPDHPDVDFVQ